MNAIRWALPSRRGPAAITAGAGAAEQWLRPRRLDYVPLNECLAVVRLSAGIGSEAIRPGAVALLVGSGPEAWSHPAIGSVTNRDERRGKARDEFLWRVTFALPLEVVENVHATFELLADERPPLALPAPVLCTIGALSEPWPSSPWAKSLLGPAAWRRLAALSAAAAVAGSATPAAVAYAGARAGRLRPSDARAVAHAIATRTSHNVSAPEIVVRQRRHTVSPAAGSALGAPSAAAHSGRTRLADHAGVSAHAGAGGHSQRTGTPAHGGSSARADHRAAPAPGHHVGSVNHPAGASHIGGGVRVSGGHHDAGSAFQRGTGGAKFAGPALDAPVQVAPATTTPAAPATTTPAAPATTPAASIPVVPGGDRATGLYLGGRSGHQHHDPPVAQKRIREDPGGGAVTNPAPPTPAATPAPPSLPQVSPPAWPSAPQPTILPSAAPGEPDGDSDDSQVIPAPQGGTTVLGGFDQPPTFLVSIYKRAGRRYNVPWRILAAINSIETDYGRNLNVSSAGAIGWMQFMPATWSAYGVSARGHGKPNPYNPADAILTAARYLAASGASTDLRSAIFSYNHANWYVDQVLARARIIYDVVSSRHVKGYALPLDPQYMHQLGRTDDGLDIETAPDGAPVYSITPGIVTAVASDPSGFGPNYPVIDVTAGPLAGKNIYYGHVATSLVKVGQRVDAGQPIAVMGHTGDAAGLGHGHIEIGFSTAYGDPLDHHGATAATAAGAAMRQVIVALAELYGIKTS